jgi:hypothetical protein
LAWISSRGDVARNADELDLEHAVAARRVVVEQRGADLAVLLALLEQLHAGGDVAHERLLEALDKNVTILVLLDLEHVALLVARRGLLTSRSKTCSL